MDRINAHEGPEVTLRRLRDSFATFGDGPANTQDIAALDAGIAALHAPGKFVGIAEQMPGADGFTLVCFDSKAVPAGTKVYVRANGEGGTP